MATEEAPAKPAWLNPSLLRDQQHALLVLLQASLAVLKDAQVPCWLTGGSLLGALRHGGFIPHDDDVDLEALEADLTKIEAAFEGRAPLAFRRGGRWNTTPVAHVGLRSGPTQDCEVELDIFLREEPLQAEKDFPSAEEIFPLCTIDFHGIQVPAPGRPEPFLQRLYGVDWQSTVRVWSHDFNPFHSLAHDPERVSMSLDAYTEMVTAAGYQSPRTSADPWEALRLLEGAGVLLALRKNREETWLEKLQRRNREQAEA
ncbi:Fktn, partial [Symbiodinium sp. CCMP2456]